METAETASLKAAVEHGRIEAIDETAGAAGMLLAGKEEVPDQVPDVTPLPPQTTPSTGQTPAATTQQAMPSAAPDVMGEGGLPSPQNLDAASASSSAASSESIAAKSKAPVAASLTPSAESLRAWSLKCIKAQQSRDPAMIERAKKQAMLRTRAAKHYKTASRIKSSNAMSSHAYFGAMRKVKAKKRAASMPMRKSKRPTPTSALASGAAPIAAPEAPIAAPEAPIAAPEADMEYDDIATEASGYLMQVQQATVRAASEESDDEERGMLEEMSSALGLSAAAAEAESIYDRPAAAPGAIDGSAEVTMMPALSAAREEYASPLYAASCKSRAVQLATAVDTVEEAEAVDLLSQLRAEPDADDERAALFKLYEANLETVELARKGLFDFWGEAGPDFADHAMVKSSIETEIAKIDSADNMGIVFDDRVWFVHGMAVKVTKNNGMIDGVLRTIRSKLDLLGSQDDCPICLEPLEGLDKVALGCAHTVCANCWAHWAQVQREAHRPAFCPLCKQDKFIADMHSSPYYAAVAP